MSPIIRRIFGLAALSISLIILLWGAWPLEKRSRSAPILLQEGSIPPTASNVPGYNARQAKLEWPGTMRAGDPGSIRFELEAVRSGTALGIGSGGESVDHWLVQARLDLAGVAAVPPGEVSEPLRPGHPALFQWDVRTKKPGLYQGTLWIYSRAVPGQAGEEGLEQNRQVLSAQRFEFRVINLFGLGGTQARILGVTGAVLSLLITLETYLEKFWNRPDSATNHPTF